MCRGNLSMVAMGTLHSRAGMDSRPTHTPRLLTPLPQATTLPLSQRMVSSHLLPLAAL